MLLSFCLMALSRFSIGWLVLGTFLMDAGAQANQISNQTRIYALAGEMRNRLTSVYMVIFFLGGTAGTAVGSYAWEHAGWNGSCSVGIALTAIGLGFLLIHTRRKRSVAL
jgi:predicted MFS family arabinose efflux permease